MLDSKPTLFIVDDDASIRRALCLLIKSVGLSVKAYSSGPEFLGAYTPSIPGCLVLDLRMPNMSGLELQSELSKRSMDIDDGCLRNPELQDLEYETARMLTVDGPPTMAGTRTVGGEPFQTRIRLPVFGVRRRWARRGPWRFT